MRGNGGWFAATTRRGRSVSTSSRASELSRTLDQSQVRLAAGDCAFHFTRIANDDVEANTRIGGVECREPPRQPVACDCVACRDQDRAGRKSCKVFEYRPRHRRTIEHCAGLLQELPPGLGQFDPAAHPIEQMRAVAGFKRCNGGRGCRLGYPQCGGRTGYMAAVGNGNEYAQLIESHGYIIDFAYGFDKN